MARVMRQHVEDPSQVRSYRVVSTVNIKANVRGGPWTQVTDVMHSEDEKLGIGSYKHHTGEVYGLYHDRMARLTLYQREGGSWQTWEKLHNLDEEESPAGETRTWPCKPSSIAVTTFEAADLTIIAASYKALKKSAGNLESRIYVRASTGRVFQRTNSWERYSTLRGTSITYNYDQFCEFSDFNVPVVFPDDLPPRSAPPET